ncbi:MAG: hypothetical protein FJX03_07465 [Alphaproteobacteria bacterium]|nr:hypothetical protein [Alphaproteobacteria bacterium]
MLKIYRIILSYILLSLFMIASSSYGTFAADAREHKTHVLPSPQKAMSSYGGIEHRESIEKVRVSSCVSLGGSCIARINDVLDGANEFVVSFMYRFNSPTLIRTLERKHLASIPVIIFLDYGQTYESSSEGSHYPQYARQLIDSVPTSLVKLGGRSYHQKVYISKKSGEQAIVILGSANATFEADNEHSEDMVFVQSNTLAHFYLQEFEKLLRMEPPKKASATEFPEQQVMVFHEHRVLKGASNTDYLSKLRGLLNSKDQPTLMGAHIGDVVSLAISTGFPNDGGTQRCLNIVNDALGSDQSEFLFLFENFISLNEALSGEKIGENLKSKTPKLIVLDKNKHNAASVKGLESKDNTVLLFKPFSGGKFHHKLIIHYPKEGSPIVYTGSFHISTNAVQRNSENIIGIRSPELADEYLASILLNSGLGEQPKVWRFIFKYEQRLRKLRVSQSFQDSRVLQTARKILQKCQKNMERYLDRLDRVETHLQMAASDHDQQLEIGKYFEHCIRQFQEGNGQDKLRAIEELKGHVFKGSVMQIYLTDLKEKWKEIRSKFEDVDVLPDFDGNHLEDWFEEMKVWIENTKEEQQSQKLPFKEELATIETIHIALYDLNEYEATFSRLHDLEEVLILFLKK